MPKTNCLGCGIPITYARRDRPPEYCPNCAFMAIYKPKAKAVEVKPLIFTEMPKTVIDFKTEQFKYVGVKSSDEEIIEDDKSLSGVTPVELRPRRKK